MHGVFLSLLQVVIVLTNCDIFTTSIKYPQHISLSKHVCDQHRYTALVDGSWKDFAIMSAGDGGCIFSPCNSKGALQTFKSIGVQNIIARSKNNGDELHAKLSGNDVLAHKSCYCSYISNTRHSNQRKRKHSTETDDASKRLTRNQIGNFKFTRDCLLCGNECKPKSKKNPHRWVKVRQCCTVDRDGDLTFKQQLEKLCQVRQDQWSNEVALRLSGVIDLPAEGAQYHVHCYDRFRKVLPTHSTCTESAEKALGSVISMMCENANDTWTTTELYSKYISYSGFQPKRKFMSDLTHHFGDEMLVLHIDGCDSVVGMKTKLGSLIKIVKDGKRQKDDDDDLEQLVQRIRNESDALRTSEDYNLSDFTRDKVIENTSATLLKLVSSLVSRGTITKPSLTLAQCIQQHVSGLCRNQTALGLAVKLHHKYGSSELIKLLNEHGITSTYDEVLRFRASAAKFVSDNPTAYHQQLGLTSEIGPIFSWADNFDLHIASPNGTKSTHSMVMEFTQHPAGIINTGGIGVMQLKIPRLKKHHISSLRLTRQDLALEHYTGPSKLNPPLLPARAMTDEESQLQSSAVVFSQQRDAAWLSQVHTNEKPVDWAGFNAIEDRAVEDSAQKPKTLVVFGPMIDSPPAHPDTVLTTVLYLERSLKAFGMKYTHLTVDMQLYQTACLVQWNDPKRWANLILHPGMMHTLMSFLGCIGVLMRASGLETLISAAFGGIPSLLTGKAWPKALRAYRIVLSVLLQRFYSNEAKTYRELSDYLEKAREHPTGRLWVDCLIKPTLLALMFLRGERNGDFLLQQHCLKAMLPYFFAAGHQHYARYISWYVRQMEHLPRAAKKDLLAGAHVCRHSDGGTAVPAGQFGEQTYIKRGKGAGGVKVISTNPQQVAVWVNSFSVCAHLDLAMEQMYNEAEKPGRYGGAGADNIHREEGEERRKLGEADRKKILEELEKCSHPLIGHHEDVYNICNGQVAPDTVNVQDALAIGSEQSNAFSASLCSDFHSTIHKKVKTMEALKKHITVKDKAVYDIETLFSRLMVVGQQRGVDIAEVFNHELSPVPPSLIDEYGCLRKGDKAALVKRLGVPADSAPAPDVVLVDAGQLLYHVVWPAAGTVGDLARGIEARLARYPPESSKLVLFDQYDQQAPSAKDHERARRGRAKACHLAPNTILPCRESILHNTKNKDLLNSLLCTYPMLHNIQLVSKHDCDVTHAEADITLCSYMLKAVSDGAETVRILSDDTDVFVLLVYWTARKQVDARIQMEKWNGEVLDINTTVDSLGPKKCSQLLGIHALSGCDTVSYPFGKGKQSALKLLEMDDQDLDHVLGQPDATHAQLKATADNFFLHLYGQTSCATMNEARARTYLGRKKLPQLKKLPPTDANLQLHVLRAHLQMLLWKAADQRDPPEEAGQITEFGWTVEGCNVVPTVSAAPVAPPALLDVVSCSCTAQRRACKGPRCSCNSAGLSCMYILLQV